MKLKTGFMLKEIAGECVVVPSNADLNFNGMITLNSTGKFLWQSLEKETTLEELVSLMTAKYDIDEETAKSDVTAFVNKLKERNFLD